MPWNMELYRLVYSLNAHSDSIKILNFIGTSFKCLSGSLDGTVNLFNLKNKTLMRNNNLKSQIILTLMIPNTRSILVSCENHLFLRFDLMTRKKLCQLQIRQVIFTKVFSILIN